jgi:hypothetical protein
MKQTIVEGYLTQQKLEQVLKNESSFIFEGSEIPVPDSKLRFDFVVKDKETSKKIAIEFNGYQHYTNPKVILNDERKQKIAKTHNIRLVSIPYWVQLNNETFKYYFKRKPTTEIIQNYPHGFIDKKALLPAAFCSLGVCRFTEEHRKLPKKIEQEVYNSIYDKIYMELLSPEEVLPVDLIDDTHWELFQEAWEDLDKEYLQIVNEKVGK